MLPGSEGPSVQVTSVPAFMVPYSLSFSARVSSHRPVSKVESNSPLEPLKYLSADQTQATVGKKLMLLLDVVFTNRINLITIIFDLQFKLAEEYKFDRDVELLIYYKDAQQPSAVVEAGEASAEPGEQRTIMLCFCQCQMFDFLSACVLGLPLPLDFIHC